MKQNDAFSVNQLCADMLKELEHDDGRLTRQRRRLVELIAQGGCRTPKDLWCKAQELGLNVSISTVYRLLNSLESLGCIQRISSIGVDRPLPVSGKLCDVKGQELQPLKDVDLTELIRLGLLSKGLIAENSEIKVAMRGQALEVTLERKGAA